jgi:hypothetical protein
MLSEERIPLWIRLLEQIALEAKGRKRKRLRKSVDKI